MQWRRQKKQWGGGKNGGDIICSNENILSFSWQVFALKQVQSSLFHQIAMRM